MWRKSESWEQMPARHRWARRRSCGTARGTRPAAEAAAEAVGHPPPLPHQGPLGARTGAPEGQGVAGKDCGPEVTLLSWRPCVGAALVISEAGYRRSVCGRAFSTEAIPAQGQTSQRSAIQSPNRREETGTRVG
jgi:hypothetical protein